MSARLEVGKVIEFEFIQVTDEALWYQVRIQFRNDHPYSGYCVNHDGSHVRAPN